MDSLELEQVWFTSQGWKDFSCNLGVIKELQSCLAYVDIDPLTIAHFIDLNSSRLEHLRGILRFNRKTTMKSLIAQENALPALEMFRNDAPCMDVCGTLGMLTSM
jgi:hypothetical protein